MTTHWSSPLRFPCGDFKPIGLKSTCQLFSHPDALSISTLSPIKFFLLDILLFHTISKSWQIYVLSCSTTGISNKLDCDWHLSKKGISHCKPQSVSGRSVVLVATWACDWYLKGEGKIYGAETLTSETWWYIQVDSVTINFNCRKPSWYQRIAY